MKRLKIFLASSVMALMVSLPAAAGIFTNQADVKVENSPTSDGVLVFVFQPKGGRSEQIEVEVEGTWTEGMVARQIQGTFDDYLGANYDVSWSNKRKVTICKLGGKKRFYLGLKGQSAKGVTVAIDYD